MNDFLVALLVALLCLYLWVKDHDRETLIKQSACQHYYTTVARMRDMFHPIGIPVKKCIACGMQWYLYQPYLTWERFVKEFEQETADRAQQYQRHKAWHDRESKAREQGDASGTGQQSD